MRFKLKYQLRTCFLQLIVLLCSSFVSIQSHANNDKVDNSFGTGFGVGFALVRFDTSFKFTDKETGRKVFVDADGNLGLPDIQALPVIYGQYRFTNKHAIGFNYFKVKRESAIFNFDENLDDVHIKGSALFRDETYFFNVKYINTLFEDSRSRVQILFGLNIMDIKYVLEAEGEIIYTDTPTTTYESLREEVSVLAPLPLIGLEFINSFTKEWSVQTNISLVAGNYKDVRAWVVNTNVSAIYQISPNMGATIGIAYFDADVAVNDNLKRNEIKYGYDGVNIGLHVVF